jgi:hypothetical protein
VAGFDEVKDKRLLSGQYTWFATWLIVTIFAFILQPSSHGHGTHTQIGLPSCPSVTLFDRPCPGCGLTTSWTRLVRGDLSGSFQAHALGPALYLLYTVTALGGIASALRMRRFVSGDRMNWLILGGLLVFLAYGFVRFALVTYESPLHPWNWAPQKGKSTGPAQE